MTVGDRPSPPGADALPDFLAAAPVTRRLVELAARAAPRAASVLITGESGTGKSHLARSMHELARGSIAPYVIIDCGNLPEGLAENELFGHEAGAYSGAVGRQPGKFEVARKGTALLDRVSDLPPEVQGKLLRVLQERTFERVGGHDTVRVEAAIIATSTEHLPELVRRGAFREDLYYRLNVVSLAVPPLRERPEDVPVLAHAFLARLSGRLGRQLRLAPASVALLIRQAWPGNVRELQNVLERVATLTDATTLEPAAFRDAIAEPEPAPDRAVSELADARLSLQELERRYVAQVLRGTGGRIGEAARILGIHRKTLLEKRKKYGLD